MKGMRMRVDGSVCLSMCVVGYLRDDVAHDDDQDRRREEADEAARQVRHDDRDEHVDRHVTKQKGAEQQVAVRAHGRDFLGCVMRMVRFY